ncbi:MAG: hypothetical protein WCA35_15540 [Kovacikia sp.]
MNRSQIRQLAQLSASESYLKTRQDRQTAISTNPATTALLGERDPARGKTTLALLNSGTLQAKLITTGSGAGQGSIMPSVTVGRGGNYADARPS